MHAAFEHCETLVRERDRDRFLSYLYAPSTLRSHLFAIAAFDLEIERVPDAVREPMAGEIRLQWWREALAGERNDEADANPVAAALLDTMRHFDLPAAELIALIDARQFDLLGQPMESQNDLQKIFDARIGGPLRLAARILAPEWTPGGAPSDAALALGLTGILRNLGRDVAKGRLYVPLDLLAEHDVHTASVFAGEVSEGLKNAMRVLSNDAKAAFARVRVNGIPQTIIPALLPLSLVPSLLKRIEGSDDPFRTRVELSALKSQFLLWRAARRGRV